MSSDKVYIAIDLKSFYASVECIERKLNPMTTNLVVADMSRTEKTIGLAVSPSLKSFGIPGRPRLFEVVQKVKEVNNERRRKAGKLVGESYNINELNENPSLAVGYIVAPPRMAHYMDYSARIYQVYLKHVAPEDIHVYSIDEVFIDATGYLKSRGMNGLPPTAQNQLNKRSDTSFGRFSPLSVRSFLRFFITFSVSKP